MNWWQSKTNQYLIGAVLALVIGVAVVSQQKAPPPAPTTTTTTSTTTTERPKPTDKAGAFRTPTSAFEVDPRSADWVNRLMTSASIKPDFPKTSADFPATEFGYDIPSNNFGVPVYDAAEATMRAVVRRKSAGFVGTTNLSPTDTIPWNPAWRPADGQDSYMQIRDYKTGQQWGLWNVSWWSYQTPYNSNFSCLQNGENLPPIWLFGHNYGGVGYDQSTMLCAASFFTSRSPDGTLNDFRISTANNPLASGGGWDVPSLSATSVASGKVDYSLHLMVANTMGGPQCTPAQRLDPAAIGNVCGDAIAPAGNFEKRNATYSPFELSSQLPEGMRFSITQTDAEIQTWLDSRGWTGAKRETARVIAVGLRDYGFLIGDSTGGGASFNTTSIENPKDKALWATLGIDGKSGNEKDLLYGLFRADRLVAFKSSVNICSGIESNFHCWAEATR